VTWHSACRICICLWKPELAGVFIAGQFRDRTIVLAKRKNAFSV
jgi:hypothetical protein